MNTCATCEHWAGDDDATDARFVCVYLTSGYDYTQPYRVSYSRPVGVVYTSHDFGCVEWLPREEEP